MIDHVIAPTSILRGLNDGEILRLAQRDLEDQVLVLNDWHRSSDEALFVTGCLALQGMVGLGEDRVRSNSWYLTRLVSIRACLITGLTQGLNSDLRP